MDWRQNTFPTAVTGGSGSPGTEQLTSRMADFQDQQGWLASLDYSLAFDRIDPTAATATVGKLGLQTGLCQTLVFQWKHQRRLLQWRKDTYANPVETDKAVPQGDAISPLALRVYMCAGYNHVETQAPPQHTDRSQCIYIYMDDRTWTCTSPELLIRTLKAWHGRKARQNTTCGQHAPQTRATQRNPTSISCPGRADPTVRMDPGLFYHQSYAAH